MPALVEPISSAVMKFLAGSALICAACASVSGNPDAAQSSDAAVTDTPGSGARCDPGKPFGAAAPVQELNSSNDEFSFTMTRDELTGFVGHIVQPPTPSATILVTHRASLTAPFSTPDASVTGAINGATGDEHSPWPMGSSCISIARSAPRSPCSPRRARTRAPHSDTRDRDVVCMPVGK